MHGLICHRFVTKWIKRLLFVTNHLLFYLFARTRDTGNFRQRSEDLFGAAILLAGSPVKRTRGETLQ